jgi:cytosine/adenosine deaminase-related metal-dependent hydrolase
MKQGVLVLDDDGRVVDLLDSREGIENLEVFDGFLCPGFVNTHCHLELSHLFGKLPEQTGLPAFIAQVPQQRGASKQEIQEAIVAADQQMWNNGIVAVGDISNTADTFALKANSPIYYHSFIELFGLAEEKATKIFEAGLALKQACPTSSSIVPHATYSVSQALFELIKEHQEGGLLSVHNQETATEDLLFEKGEGAMYEQLSAFGKLHISQQSALKTTLPKLAEVPTLLVHNTYTTAADVAWAAAENKQLYWCTCPQANLYIEGCLPNYANFKEVKMTIGTDSLASNHSLSIWEEVQTIREHTDIELNTLLTWACKNGAEFLQQPFLGSFEKGKRPGVNHIHQGKVKKVA